jgi:tetraacyldisaccharide 4'-kinase
MLYDNHILPAQSVALPTICVGNLAVGGTGKTPHVEYLVQLLQSRYKIAVLSRGYGRKTHGFLMADAQATANTIGDEPMQIHRHFPDIPVAVCENRVRGIKQLQRMVNDLQVVILDDALQHRKIKCGMNVLLTTADNLYINDHLLPLGHLRDLKHRSLAAHAIIVTKCPENMRPIDKRVIDNMLHLPAFQQLYFSRFKYQDFEPSLTEHKQKVLVLSAIANPQYLFCHVKKTFPKATCLAFPDHHRFTKKDEALIENKAKKHDVVFTTAKDYERLLLTNLPNVLGDKLQVIPVTVQIDVDAKSFEKQVITYIDETLRKNSKQHLK